MQYCAKVLSYYSFLYILFPRNETTRLSEGLSVFFCIVMKCCVFTLTYESFKHWMMNECWVYTWQTIWQRTISTTTKCRYLKSCLDGVQHVLWGNWTNWGQIEDKRGRGRPKALSVLSDSHILNREENPAKTWHGTWEMLLAVQLIHLLFTEMVSVVEWLSRSHF